MIVTKSNFLYALTLVMLYYQKNRTGNHNLLGTCKVRKKLCSIHCNHVESCKFPTGVHVFLKIFNLKTKKKLNSSRADFRFCGKCEMFEIATALSITHVSMCHTHLWSFPVLYSMSISEFPIPSSKNRFARAALFSPFLSHTTKCDHGTVGRETSE